MLNELVMYPSFPSSDRQVHESIALLDGAHNAQAAAALAVEIDTKLRYPVSDSHPRSPITFVIGTSDSKPVSEILQPLLRPGDSVFAVEFSPVAGMPWIQSTSADTIASAARELLGHL